MSDSTDGTDDIFPEGFFVQVPVWLIGSAAGKFADLLKVRSPKSGAEAIAVFTDEAGAQTCIESAPQPELRRLCKIPTNLAFIGLLAVLEKKGITDVSFDPTQAKTFTRSVAEVQDEFIRGID